MVLYSELFQIEVMEGDGVGNWNDRFRFPPPGFEEGPVGQFPPVPDLHGGVNQVPAPVGFGQMGPAPAGPRAPGGGNRVPFPPGFGQNPPGVPVGHLPPVGLVPGGGNQVPVHLGCYFAGMFILQF